jgi:hypothetical protein
MQKSQPAPTSKLSRISHAMRSANALQQVSTFNFGAGSLHEMNLKRGRL